MRPAAVIEAVLEDVESGQRLVVGEPAVAGPVDPQLLQQVAAAGAPERVAVRALVR
jgi:hypothetical protein